MKRLLSGRVPENNLGRGIICKLCFIMRNVIKPNLVGVVSL